MLNQIAIALLGLAAVFLSQSESEERRRYACIAGLISQPFWFYETYIAGQWGIFLLSVFYTLGWCKGIITYWIKPYRASK